MENLKLDTKNIMFLLVNSPTLSQNKIKPKIAISSIFNFWWVMHAISNKMLLENLISRDLKNCKNQLQSYWNVIYTTFWFHNNSKSAQSSQKLLGIGHWNTKNYEELINE